MGQIAWSAVEAYAKVKVRGHFTWSMEMLLEHARLFQGKHGALERFLQLLYVEKGSWISRKMISGAEVRCLGENPDNLDAATFYSYCAAIPGVSPKRRRCVDGFRNLVEKSSDQA